MGGFANPQELGQPAAPSFTVLLPRVALIGISKEARRGRRPVDHRADPILTLDRPVRSAPDEDRRGAERQDRVRRVGAHYDTRGAALQTDARRALWSLH